MPLNIRPGITVRRPRREVAVVMFDPRHEESWLDTFRRDDANEEPIDPDAPHERLLRLPLRERVIPVRVTARDAERFLEFQAEEPFELLIRQELESIPEGTLVRIRVRIRLRGLGRLLKPLITWRLRRSLIADLTALKSIVENSPHRGIAAARPAVADPPRAPDAGTTPAQPAWPVDKGATPNW